MNMRPDASHLCWADLAWLLHNRRPAAAVARRLLLLITAEAVSFVGLRDTVVYAEKPNAAISNDYVRDIPGRYEFL